MVLHVDLSAERSVAALSTASVPREDDCDNSNTNDTAPSTSGRGNGDTALGAKTKQQQQRSYRGVDRSRPIAAGDVVIVYERHDRTRAVVVTPGEKYNNQFGAFFHDVSCCVFFFFRRRRARNLAFLKHATAVTAAVFAGVDD